MRRDKVQIQHFHEITTIYSFIPLNILATLILCLIERSSMICVHLVSKSHQHKNG